MGFSRLIIVVAIIWLAWFVYQRFQQNLLNRRNTVKKKSTIESIIVKCAVCEVHVPKSEAVEAEGVFYCSDAHRKL